jgi:hypothetical protein
MASRPLKTLKHFVEFKPLMEGNNGAAKRIGACSGLQWFAVPCSGFDGTRASSAKRGSFKIQRLAPSANSRKLAALVS